MTENVKSVRKARNVYKTGNGEVVPGVTTVLALRAKPALVEWAFRLGRDNPRLNSTREYVDDLANIGKAAHAMIAAHLMNEAPDISDFTPNDVEAAQIPLAKFKAWASSKKIEVLSVEEAVISDKYRYGGTLDLYAKVDGKPSVLDLKTSRAIYDEMVIQVSAYAGAKMEMGFPVEQVGIIQIGRVEAEGFSDRMVAEWANHFNAFLALRTLYDIERHIEAKGSYAGGRLWRPEFSPWHNKE